MIMRFAKYDTKFLQILFWETLENAPLFIGFLLAVRIRSENLVLALVCLLAGTALGAGLIHLTEVKKFSNQPALKETWTNFGIFTILAIPFIFYFSASGVWWSNWVTDIVLGAVAGIALAVGESWGWSNTVGVKLHAVSMTIAAVLFLFGIRLIYQIESLAVMLIFGLVFTLLISILIVRLEYWPMKKSDLASPSN
jgi:hypothetical protein